MIRKFLVLSAFLSLSFSTYAGLWVEPLVGYKIASVDFNIYNAGASLNGDYEYKFVGHQFGLKLGYAAPIGIVIGADGRMGSFESEQESGVFALQNGKVDNDDTSLGAFIAITAVPFLNFWGTYKFSYESEETTGANVGDISAGDGYGFGVGFTGIPFLSLNIEMNKITIDETRDVSAGTVTKYPSSNTSQQDKTEYVFSISAPFDLF